MSSLVRGASSSSDSTATSRSWRTSSETIDCIAARYILRLTFCEKSRGRAANARPPPTQIGLRIEPTRAWPVPFWLHGFLPPPRTSARDFCALVPARPAGHVGGDDLMHERFVVGAAEGGIRQLDFARGGGIL